MKVLASDFDGTLFFGEEFRQEDIKAIKEFQKQGHLFGLCSGRPYKGAKKASKGYIDFDFYIASSGALIVDNHDHILHEECIDFELMKAIYTKYEKDCGVCVQGDGTIYRVFNKIELPELQIIVDSLEDLKEVHIYGLSINARTEKNAKEKCQEINELFDGVSAYQNKEYIDIVKKGCSKGHAIDQLKELLNIEHIAGIGDSYNDLPLLQHADHAFTFHTSPQVVKDTADDLVDSVSEAIHILMDK